jgi:hypothetical protein
MSMDLPVLDPSVHPSARCRFCARRADAVVVGTVGGRDPICRFCAAAIAAGFERPDSVAAQCDPMGVSDIAIRAGVAPATVRSWQLRGRFPQAPYVVSGQAAWEWRDVEALVMSRAKMGQGSLAFQMTAVPREVRRLLVRVGAEEKELDVGSGYTRQWFDPPIGEPVDISAHGELDGMPKGFAGRWMVTGQPVDTDAFAYSMFPRMAVLLIGARHILGAS